MKYLTAILIGASIFVYLLFYAPIIKASEVIFSDHFSKPVLENWEITHNWGKNRFGICLDTSAPTTLFIQEEKLNLTVDGTECLMVLTPLGLDLSHTNTFSSTFKYKFAESTFMDRSALILWQDQDNWYRFKFFADKIVLEKKVLGQNYSLANNEAKYNFVADQTYDFEIKINQGDQVILTIDGDVVIRVFDQSPFLSGHIKTGLMVGADQVYRSVNIFDDYIIKSLSINELGNLLPVIKQKQNDPIWGQDIYDHADSWSNKPTIHRWGCALASMSMILNYHGIDTLPGGQEITPRTLNSWLINQPDGYIGQGLLNWQAITRLTAKISELKGTPKLEYGRIGGGGLNGPISQISSGLPVILQIDGHFLVGNGFTPTKDDLNITDPIYPFVLFSQHERTLLSTRTFTPSQTDLSYFLVLTDSETNLIFRNDKDEIILADSYIEYISQVEETDGQIFETGQKTKSQKIYQIAKPESGTYQIEIETTNNAYDLDFYVYDQHGEVTHFQKSSPSGAENALELNFDKEGTTTLETVTTEPEPLFTWNDLALLTNTIEENYPGEKPLTEQIRLAILWAILTPSSDQIRYLELIKTIVDASLSPEEIRQLFLKGLQQIKESI